MKKSNMFYIISIGCFVGIMIANTTQTQILLSTMSIIEFYVASEQEKIE